MKEIIRRIRFRPYRKGMGPSFRLTVWDCNEFKPPNHHRLGYKLEMMDQRHACADPQQTTCGRCGKAWCGHCFAAPAALCHWCNGNADAATEWGAVVLFEGEDFGCPTCTAVDSDSTVESIMTFLTLRPGDTDSDFFADYTEEQLDYCSQHAEALASEVMARFEETS